MSGRKNMFTLLGLLALTPALAHADLLTGTRVEIPIEKIFAPEAGFDDNDRVEIVVHGQLTNSCYRLGDTVVEPGADGQSYTVKQFALRIDNGICGDQAAMAPHLMVAVPFNKVVEVGTLSAAKYQFKYSSGPNQTVSRPLDVSPATAPTIDDFPYAAVTNAMVLEVVNGAQEVKVLLSGVLNSSCTHLDQVKVTPEKDVLVVQPILKVDADVKCAQVLIPFQREINLGKLAPGEYLAHIRAMNGAAVNRVFTVEK